jgi:acyl dehydratase
VGHELKPGKQIPELRVTPDRYLPYRYAGASGDFNPIHLDPDFAREAGLPRTILHGLYCVGLIARAAVDAAGGDPRVLRRLRLQFRAMAFPEQELVIAGSVKDVGEARGRIEVYADQQERALLGKTEVELEMRRDRSS